MVASNSQSALIKCLNDKPSSSLRPRRFIFKTFKERIKETKIDVYRSLDPLKSEPAEGSSFFRDSLLAWRELNTSEDFISFYEEMMPWVQTLPQVLLHKDVIMSNLLSRVRIEAKLSLEPILSLIADLSRDLQEDFLPFLQNITKSLADLLEIGGEKEPEILDQVFRSWSYIVLHLQKHLTKDISNVFRITVRLRYHPKVYVQELMAEATSLLLRKAPDKQLKKGIRKILTEVKKKPFSLRKSGASSLLWHAMRGTSLRMHSRATQILQTLIHEVKGSGDKVSQDVIVEVIIGALRRIFKEFPFEELNIVLNWLLEELRRELYSEDSSHLCHSLSLLIFVTSSEYGSKISDYERVLQLVELLVQKLVPDASCNKENFSCEILDRVLHLMLCLVSVPKIFNDSSVISSISKQWSPVFMLKSSSVLKFMKELVQKEPSVVDGFRGLMMSAMSDLIDASPEEVIHLMMNFIDRRQDQLQLSNGLNLEAPESICNFFHGKLKHWITRVNDIARNTDRSRDPVLWSDLSLLWGILLSYPSIGSNADISLVTDLIYELDLLCRNEFENISGVEKTAWESLIGAALGSYHKLLLWKNSELSEFVIFFLTLGKRYQSSMQVLYATANFLDSALGSAGQEATASIMHYLDILFGSADAVQTFAENLCAPNKEIRLATLRILRHYRSTDSQFSCENHVLSKGYQPSTQTSECSSVIQILYSIEESPITVTTGRFVVPFSRIQAGLSIGGISESHVLLLFYGLIGILHNRFRGLWEPVIDCLAKLIEEHHGVWNKFVEYLGKFQADCSMSCRAKMSARDNCSGLDECFESFVNRDFETTPCSTVLSLLLKALQRKSSIAESRSRQLIPLFFKFMGGLDAEFSVSNLYSHLDSNNGSNKNKWTHGKEWREILKEWLDLWKLMRNPKSLYQSQTLKDVLINRLLDDFEPEIQLKVLDCLLNWKDSFLLPYDQNLRNLITSKNLREELTTWSLSKESHHIQELHRDNLIPLVIRILAAKVRNLRTLGSRKHASLRHRKAILCFLTQLELNELPLFFSLLLKSLQPNEGFDCFIWSSVDDFLDSKFFDKLPEIIIDDLSWKKRSGFLHVVEDIVGSFDQSNIAPFLNTLMVFVVWILKNCSPNIESSSGSSVEQINSAETLAKLSSNARKDMRSLCLKVISLVLNKYESYHFWPYFWDTFFWAVKPLIDAFKEEGPSSDKPSSLLSCFLAMSRSPVFVSLLDREGGLIPSIFSILTVNTASDALINSVLEFVENLLDYEKICRLHIEGLIHSLSHRYAHREGANRKHIIWPGKAELRIFKLLLKYIYNTSDAQCFINIMLPFLTKRGLSEEQRLEVLCIIKGLIPILGVDTYGKVLTAVYPLLVASGLSVRLLICAILSKLSAKDSSICYLASLVQNLNAVSLEEMEELDYDTRLEAYKEITPNFFSLNYENFALVILSHCVYDMSSDEATLRKCASDALLSFIKFGSSILEHEEDDHLPYASEDGTHQVETGGAFKWTKSAVLRIINNIFLRHIGEAMTKENYVRQEWIHLLKDMVLALPGVLMLNSLRPLCSEDAEVDFFNNILHIQKHRRAKALTRFRNAISNGELSEKIVVKIFVPLFFNMLYEVEDGKGEHVRDACVGTLASIAGIMEWGHYVSFVMRCFREINLKPKKQKVLLRLVCSILDRFHFFKTQIHNDSAFCGTADQPFNSCSTVEVENILQKSILPRIQRFLTTNNDGVNIGASLAAVKLLKLLPPEALESQFPSILHKITSSLKSHLESVRDDARSALAAILKELGGPILRPILNALQATLKRGYELHVLGYTVHFLFTKNLDIFLVNRHDDHDKKLDDGCLEQILLITKNDILGSISEEKEVGKIASKMKETRKSMSFDTLKLIAQCVTFKNQASKLLLPIKSCLQNHLTQKVQFKIREMLNHLALGIKQHNCFCSDKSIDLFVFIEGCLEDGIGEGNTQNSHLIAVFALSLVHDRLKKNLDKSDERLMSVFDSLVQQVGRCITSKFEDVVAAALKCLVPLLRMPLPSIQSQANKIKNLSLELAYKSSSNGPLMKSCFKLLAVLLRGNRVTLSDDQLLMLIQFPVFVDLENNPSLEALSLLKDVVRRKLVVPEIYDLVKRIAELMVTSQLEPVRKECSKIFLRFLLDYHLSQKRLQQHLDFLLTNLKYVHPSGREAVLEMIHTILRKFPKDVVIDHSESFYFTLVECLVSENDNKVRAMISAATKQLIRRADQHALALDISLRWYSTENRKVWVVGAQVLSLFGELMIEDGSKTLEKWFWDHIKEIQPVIEVVLTTASNIVAKKEILFSDVFSIPFWRESYYTLTLVEKLSAQFPILYFRSDMEGVWNLVCKFLLHPHLRLQNASSCLVSSYFAHAQKIRSENLESSTMRLLLMKPNRVFSIAVSCCLQLKGNIYEQSITNLTIQNLAFAICELHAVAGHMSLHELWSTLVQYEQENLLEDFRTLGLESQTNLLLLSVTGDQNVEESNLLVTTLLKKMGKLALQMEDSQMKAVFTCFRIFSSHVGPHACHKYAVQLLLPLYKACEGYAGKIISDDAKHFAEETRDSIQGVMGIECFVETYNLIRKNLKVKRDRKREIVKRLPIVNPVLHAKRKLRLAEKHKAHKRRKLIKFKGGRH